LSKYEAHVRPFIKDIFINKFPGAVSLHALDAGNFSLTMGYTQLRLREGETLHRAKRIFHVSPSDTRHLDDICDFLIKYGYIRRAPVTLQFLQGKAMFTSLDLRYAFLGLKLDEESKALTTFLTPTGSFQWECLPMGGATSPAHFGNACNKMIHYEPVRDAKGELVYDKPNEVRLKKDPLPYVTNYVDDILVATPLRNSYEETLRFHFSALEQATQRLAFHGARINVMKCEFVK
jgi:hypothetical protein